MKSFENFMSEADSNHPLSLHGILEDKVWQKLNTKRLLNYFKKVVAPKQRAVQQGKTVFDNTDDKNNEVLIKKFLNHYEAVKKELDSRENLSEAKGDDKEYEAIVRKLLKKYGVEDIKDIPKDKKDDFFDELDKAHKSDKEEKGIAEAVEQLNEKNIITKKELSGIISAFDDHVTDFIDVLADHLEVADDDSYDEIHNIVTEFCYSVSGDLEKQIRKYSRVINK